MGVEAAAAHRSMPRGHHGAFPGAALAARPRFAIGLHIAISRITIDLHVRLVTTGRAGNGQHTNAEQSQILKVIGRPGWLTF